MSPERVVVPGVAEAHRPGRGARRPPVRRVGQRALQRRLDGAVQAVVGDEVAVAVAAALLEPVERAEELVVAAPERDVVADAAGLEARPRASTSARKSSVAGIEMAGEHEVLPDQQAERVAGLVEARRLVAAAAPDADHVHVGVGGGLQQVAGLRRGDAAGQRVGRDPVGAAGEDGAAVDVEARSCARPRRARRRGGCRAARRGSVRVSPPARRRRGRGAAARRCPAGHQSAGSGSVELGAARRRRPPVARPRRLPRRRRAATRQRDGARRRSRAASTSTSTVTRAGVVALARSCASAISPSGPIERDAAVEAERARARCSSPSRSRTAACAACCRSGSGSCRRARARGRAARACSSLAAAGVRAQHDLDAVLARRQRLDRRRRCSRKAESAPRAPAAPFSRTSATVSRPSRTRRPRAARRRSKLRRQRPVAVGHPAHGVFVAARGRGRGCSPAASERRMHVARHAASAAVTRPAVGERPVPERSSMSPEGRLAGGLRVQRRCSLSWSKSEALGMSKATPHRLAVPEAVVGAGADRDRSARRASSRPGCPSPSARRCR